MSTIQKEQEVKGLESQLKVLIGKREAKKTEVARIQREYQEIIKSEKNLAEKISTIKENKGITVTEHAILRYLERVKGVDLKEVEDEILTESLRTNVSVLGGNGKYPLVGCRAVLKNGTVVTIEI